MMSLDTCDACGRVIDTDTDADTECYVGQHEGMSTCACEQCRDTHRLMPRVTGGQGLGSWEQPRCACGWFGWREYAHNDCQYTNLREQEQNHLKGVET